MNRGGEGRNIVLDLSEARSVSQADHLSGKTWGEMRRETKVSKIGGNPWICELKPSARHWLEKERKARVRDKPANLQPLHRSRFYTEGSSTISRNGLKF